VGVFKFVPNHIKSWGDKEWERHVKALCRLRHGPGNFKDVPDDHCGDFGLEGFSTDGFAYQAYAAKEPVSVAALFERQRTKMNDDLHKFAKNAADISAMLGPIKIRRWSLIVPRNNSAKLVQHATKKAQEICALQLPYVDPKVFDVIVETEDDFAVERQKLIAVGLGLIGIQLEPIATGQIEEWASANDTLVSSADAKIAKIGSANTTEKQRRLRNEFIKSYIAGRNALNQLKADYPEFWEKAVQVKSDREDQLTLDMALNDASPKETIRSEIGSMAQRFKACVPGIDDQTADLFAREAISDWLLRCPLDI
jgi:hypothetical protein